LGWKPKENFGAGDGNRTHLTVITMQLITRNYWLLSDNFTAIHVLAKDHPDIAAGINQTTQKFGVFTDG
jgi:hypothetical protein